MPDSAPVADLSSEKQTRLMRQDIYLKERLQDQIDWYSKKSDYNQMWFKRLQLASILASLIIPLLAGYTDLTVYIKVLVGILGLGVAAITAILGLYKFQENWFEYRTTSESLKHEKFLFLTGAPPYDEEDSFKFLVERVESLISKEHLNWTRSMRQEGKKQKPGQGI